jgi:hypothetical protein
MRYRPLLAQGERLSHVIYLDAIALPLTGSNLFDRCRWENLEGPLGVMHLPFSILFPTFNHRRSKSEATQATRNHLATMASSRADASASEDTDIDSELDLSTELPDQDGCTKSGLSSMKSSYVSEDHWQIISDENILQGTVWYADGNVIIQAESTQFKVFQGVLTTHSPVFAAILEDTEIEEVDGCRIIRTTDAARDMKYFLEAFHSLTLPEGLTELAQITAFLRLGTRYKVPVVQRIAIRTLLTSYPSSFSAWGKRQLHRSFVPGDGASLEVLNLVREFEITQILPTVSTSSGASS